MTDAGAASRAAPALGALRLAADVRAVRVEDEIVFLDLRRDRYAVLSDPDRRIGLDPDSDRVRAEGAAAARLTEAGFAAASSFAASCRIPRPRIGLPSLPERSADPDLAPRALPVDRRDFARLRLTASLDHRLRSLASLVAWAARRPAQPPAPLEETLRRAAVFDHLLTRSRLAGDCLYRSHLLLRYLRMAGSDARWVFAVRTWPFAAHCWLQVDGTALDDAHDRLRAFHVIAAF